MEKLFKLIKKTLVLTLTNFIFVLLTISTFSCKAQNGTKYLTKSEIENDLAFLEKILQDKSSYQGLNGYEFKEDFRKYLEETEEESRTKFDFGQFLTKTIGKIGDRHSYIKGDRIRDSLYFSVAFAPYKDKVLVLDYDRAKKEHQFWNSEFPYLKSINKIPIQDLISKILPGEILAPKSSYLTRAVKELRDIEKIFKTLIIDLPNPIFLTLINKNGAEKEVSFELATKKKRARYWDERLFRNIYRLKDEQYNDKVFIDKFFRLENNIGYIQIADMVEKEDCPAFFMFLNDFMIKAK